MAYINLIESIKNAKVESFSTYTPIAESVKQVLFHTFKPELFEQLSQPPKRQNGSGKGGNTNYAEIILKKFFNKIGKVKFHPEGSQKPPDVLIKECEFEWKSSKVLSSPFMFNDSIPKGGRYYCFYARQAKKALIIPGDVLVLSLDEDVLVKNHNEIIHMRESGKSEGLCFFYPRKNMFIRNFLKYAPANGYFDYDAKTIWVPKGDKI